MGVAVSVGVNVGVIVTVGVSEGRGVAVGVAEAIVCDGIVVDVGVIVLYPPVSRTNIQPLTTNNITPIVKIIRPNGVSITNLKI